MPEGTHWGCLTFFHDHDHCRNIICLLCLWCSILACITRCFVFIIWKCFTHAQYIFCNFVGNKIPSKTSVWCFCVTMFFPNDHSYVWITPRYYLQIVVFSSVDFPTILLTCNKYIIPHSLVSTVGVIHWWSGLCYENTSTSNFSHD